MKANSVPRVRLISFFILFLATVFIGRLYYIQVVNNDVYLDKADRQYVSTSQKTFGRGSIFFQNKDGTLVSAATLKNGFIVAINPKLIKDKEDVYSKLNAILPIDKNTFIQKAGKQNDTYEELANRVDVEIGQKIADLKISGLSVYKERWRFYPGGKTGAHVVGIMGYKGDEYAGRYGLEKQYESNLVRKDGAYVNFFAQMFSDIKSAVSEEDKNGEADIVTTIEPTVQAFLESTIASIREKWGSGITGGIIMNPETGEIYAMAVEPVFDPNNPSAEKNIGVFSNPLVQSVYEMGSIFKPLTVVAGIDAGVVNSKTTYYDSGSVVVGKETISNFDKKERGTTTIEDALANSLNVGMVKIQSLLGVNRFRDYMYSFGVADKSGVDLPNESRNLADNLKSNREIEHANIAFGQGIALTPINTIRALSVVANGGYLVRPHVVKSIDYKIGISKKTEIEKKPTGLKKESSEEVSRILVYNVDSVLFEGKKKLNNYSIAAKTGTAQIAKENGGGYYDDQFLHSFIGYFPAYQPKFIVFMYTVNPKAVRFSSGTLFDPFINLAQFLINYYEIPPDR